MPPRQTPTARLEDLTAELEALRLFRRQRVITDKRKFESERNRLVRAIREIEAELEQQRRSREIARQIAEEERKAKEKRAKKNEERKLRRDLILHGTFGPDFNSTFDTIFNRIRSIRGNIRIIRRGALVDFSEFVETQERDNVYPQITTLTDLKRKFHLYDQGVFYDFAYEGSKFWIVKPSTIPALRLRQMFREGVSNCVFTPILKKLKGSLEACKSKETAKRYSQRVAKISDLEELYANGVPEDKMEDVAKASGYKIVLHDILGKELKVYNEKGKMGNIHLTNTRPNHVDEGRITLDRDFELVSQDKISQLWYEAQKKKEFYMIEGDIKNGVPRRLQLLDTAFRVEDPNEQYFEDMNKRIDLNRYKFNATKYPEVNEFIKAGRIINAWVCPFTDEKPTGHLDMPKAYTQFRKCDWYSGFLGVIHQFRSGSFDMDWIREHIGIYRIRVLKCGNALFQKLGMKVGTVHILPSPEILYFIEKGLEVSIDCGVWGSKFDFDFPDEMLQDRRYCLWSGRLGMERTTRNFSFSANSDWASHLKADYGDDCYYWSDERICSVRVPVKNVMTTHHIFAFITSYVRIQMMEAMSKFRLDQLVRVVLDGIYFTGEKPMDLEWFKEKEIKEVSVRSGFEWYCDELWNGEFPPMIVSRNTLMTGQGGAGKTYKILTDKGFNKILFATPQHVLGGDVKDKYGVSYTTIHKLIGEDCQPYIVDHSYPPVIFVDEITQISADWIDKVFAMYKDSLIILAGDLTAEGMWFQTRNGRPGEFSKIWKPHDVDILHIVGDRRSRDSELKELKLRIRDMMCKIFRGGDEGEDIVMKIWAKKHLKLNAFDDAVKMFAEGDVWIAGTHKTSDKLLESGVVSGWYRQGGFVSFVEKEDHQKRGSFTIHSFQGRTLEKGKIFISINDLFEFSMLYTAVSRAVHFDQLVFVS